MIPAYLIGLFMNRLVVDLETFLSNGPADYGMTRKVTSVLSAPRNAQHILIVDDSVTTGQSLQQSLTRIRESSFRGRITTCAAIVVPSRYACVDVTFIVMPQPRVFEWNTFHHPCIENSCFDLDGVLCVDPLPHQNDDGPSYVEFLETARPLFKPTQRIGNIVSGRLEKYREHTERWLAANGVMYGALHLVDLPSKEARMRLAAHSSHKIKVYKESGAALFYESDSQQAQDIAQGAGKPVLCVGDMSMHLPTRLHLSSVARAAEWQLRHPLGRMKGWLRQQIRNRVQRIASRSIIERGDGRQWSNG